MAEKSEHEVISDDIKRVIRETFFNNMKNEVLVEIFTKQGLNDQFNESVASLFRALGELTAKLKIAFYTVGDEQSQKRNVTRSPSVLIAPDKYRMRYTGAPLGEEGRSLLVAIMMASTGATILSEQSLKRLAELHEKRDIQVFVSPT